MTAHATTIPRPQHARAAKHCMSTEHPRNVGDLERGLSLVVGGALALYGLRRSLGHLALRLCGGALVYRGVTGRCAVYQAIGVSTASQDTELRRGYSGA